MHAYLFVGGKTEFREKALIDAAKMFGSLYEFPLQKIADVRELANFTKYSQSTKTAIVIKEIDKATKEALNAFLKILEEPGKNISYFLSCQNEQNLLSTITSRCQVKRLSSSSKGEKTDLASDFIKLTFGKKIKSLEKYKKKDEAIKYLQKIVLSAHKKLVQGKESSRQEVTLIRTAQDTINNLNANANVNLQMTNFAVHSEKSVFTKET